METDKRIEDLLDNAGLQRNDQGKVDWQQDAKQHPRNWDHISKIYTVVVVTWLELFMTAISASGAATAERATKEYGLSMTLGYFAFLTMYLLGQTVGAIVCSPISEVFGRKTIYALGSALFCVSSIVTAAPQSPVAIYFGRFFQGVAAAIPATVAFGNFEDMYDAHHRIWVVYAYTFWGISGLALGPIYSSYITNYLGWRWVYWISAIAAGASTIACVFIRESNAQQLLGSAVKKINKEVKDDSLEPATVHGHVTISSFFKNNLVHPIRLLATEPIIFFCSALCAIAFALVYGLTEALTIVYTLPPFDRSFNMMNSSLSFIALIIGQILNILPRIYDARLLGKYRKEKKRILPETKITSLITSCPALALGLWIFAWTIPPLITNVPWAISMVGLIGLGYATNDLSYILFGYATDSYGASAASAVSAISLTRTLAAAVLPLFTTQMYEGLGANKATTIFAAIATAFCITPWLFLRYGSKLRNHSKFCAQGGDVLPKENEHMKGIEEEEDGVQVNIIESEDHKESDDTSHNKKPSIDWEKHVAAFDRSIRHSRADTLVDNSTQTE